MDLLLASGLTIEFIVVILGGMLGLLYHLKLAKALFFSPSDNGTIQIQTKLYGLASIVIIQFITLIYNQNIVETLSHAESLIIGG